MVNNSKPTLKIGIDCRLVNKILNTGISRYTEFLIEYYINRFGAENIILVSNDVNFKNSNCKIFYTKFKPYNVLHFVRFYKDIRDLGINLFHVPFYSAFFKKQSDIKVIVTVHDLMYRLVPGFFGDNEFVNKVKIKVFDFIVKKSLNNADKIVSVSATTKNDLFGFYGFDSVHIPEDSDISGLDDLSILNKFNLEHKKFYFYCGNNRPHKNLNFVIDIFENSTNIFPLVLSGKGHQNSTNVISTGIVSDEELKALYKSAIAFIFPSKYEGFGLPVLESLRLGTFVIASKISAFLEFNSMNIFFFELGNKKQFREAIENTLTSEFHDEASFFNFYSKDKIYDLNDTLIKELLNRK